MSLPLVLEGSAFRFVVAGAGQIGLRKIRTLIKANVSLHIIAPELDESIQEQLTALDKVSWSERLAVPSESFETGSFVVLATNDSALNTQLAESARDQGCKVCRVDQSKGNDFAFPAVIDRDPIQISVSSRGTSPALTRHLKQRLESFIPQEYSELGRLMGDLRDRVKTSIPASVRPTFWRRWINSQVTELMLSRQRERAIEVSDQLISEPQTITQGEVYLVGAGPGDPDLLTFRALRLIQSAEVVFYDRLVSHRIRALIDPQADTFYVGKAMSDHAVPQDGINQLLVKTAQEGKRVLRLKGGDPFIFGRGGEEIEELAEAGVPFQVVPGITAASGCAAYAGIPLTHRDHAQSVRFVTGHLRDNTCNLPWNELIHPHQTLVIYMGLSGIPIICQQLMEHGMPADTPMALIEKGTLPDQCVHVSQLSEMAEYVANHDLQAPTLTIIGSVVSLHNKLSWR